MEFESPSEIGFTVYSKSGCPNCSKVKTLLKENNLIFNIIDCDEYLLEDKENFFLFIKNISDKPCNTFPIVFYECELIGGLNETKNYITKLCFSVDDNGNF